MPLKWDLDGAAAWSHLHVACCVWASSVAKFLMSTQGNVRMKSPLGTQAEGTSPPVKAGRGGGGAAPALLKGRRDAADRLETSN